VAFLFEPCLNEPRDLAVVFNDEDTHQLDAGTTCVFIRAISTC